MNHSKGCKYLTTLTIGSEQLCVNHKIVICFVFYTKVYVILTNVKTIELGWMSALPVMIVPIVLAFLEPANNMFKTC